MIWLLILAMCITWLVLMRFFTKVYIMVYVRVENARKIERLLTVYLTDFILGLFIIFCFMSPLLLISTLWKACNQNSLFLALYATVFCLCFYIGFFPALKMVDKFKKMRSWR